MLDLSITIVNWNTKDLLRHCLRSVYDQANGISFEVFVVDNASSDGSSKMVREIFPRVMLLQNTENLGFAKANNQAIRRSRGRYVLLLNPDTLVLQGALAKMVRFLDSHPQIGALGCKILAADGEVDFRGARRFPTLLSEFFDQTGLSTAFPNSTLFGGHLMSYWDHQDSKEVDLLIGACMMVRREVIQEIGLMDEDFYMYADDVEWCYRIKKAGWKIFYYADAAIVHLGGQSSKSVKIEVGVEGLRSMNRFFRKYWGRPRAWVHKILTFFVTIAKLQVFGVGFLFSKDVERDRFREKLRLHWQVLKWSLAG